MTDKKLSLKEMCALFDVTPRTMRYYEYIELISPEKQGRTRLYGAKERARMTLILRGRKVGFSLEEVRQWLELYEKDPTQRIQMEDLLRRTTEQAEELGARMAELKEAIRENEKLRDFAKHHLDKLS